LLLITISLTGCFASRAEDIEAFLRPHEIEVTAKSYFLRPPDEIEVFCSKVPEIHLQRQQIRPDGKVSFESLGEIDAAGKTPEQVAKLLQQKATELYKLEDGSPIDVRVLIYRSGVYYVLGEVYLPGPKVYTGRDTLLRAIAEAQPNPMAWRQRIQVIRPSNDKKVKPKIFEVDFDRIMTYGDTSKNVLLQEGDIVYVPPTVLAAIALKIEEFARPIGRAFSTVYIMQAGPYGGYGAAGGYGGAGGYGR